MGPGGILRRTVGCGAGVVPGARLGSTGLTVGAMSAGVPSDGIPHGGGIMAGVGVAIIPATVVAIIRRTVEGAPVHAEVMLFRREAAEVPDPAFVLLGRSVPPIWSLIWKDGLVGPPWTVEPGRSFLNVISPAPGLVASSQRVAAHIEPRLTEMEWR